MSVELRRSGGTYSRSRASQGLTVLNGGQNYAEQIGSGSASDRAKLNALGIVRNSA